jgi:[glutamine synthetase] adenylyltransferase / [glutamine synthetase]-adenylyl-L-tyrosine phosphorylase
LPTVNLPSNLARPLGAAVDIPFQHREAARQSLTRISAKIGPAIVSCLPSLLIEAPDPDSAIIFFERLLDDSPANVLRTMEQNPVVARYSVLVFGHSRYLGETLLRNPDLLTSFAREKSLDRSLSREEFKESLTGFLLTQSGTEISQALARFKRREYVRIFLRDVLKLAPLAETTSEISALADVLIEAALREADLRLRHKYGPPQNLDQGGELSVTPFAVFSLGKLGGNELNYCSDVDLLYLFGSGAEPEDSQFSNREYFIRLAQEITTNLSQNTPEGPVFRIDLRLRPQGNEGELAVSLNHALRYYAETAADWECQALIKLRLSAGDAGLAREFIRGVQPHVYTEGVNFLAVKTALVARERIHRRRLQPSHVDAGLPSVDVKLDHGGIRDIEFLVQCLQRVYGGSEPWLRSGGTLFSLHKLHDKRHISSHEFHELTNTYQFLRHLEHRLQLRDGLQIHRLPASDTELRIVLRSLMRYDCEFRMEELESEVARRMASIAEIYNRVVLQQAGKEREQAGAEFVLGPPQDATGLSPSNQQILERLARDAPPLRDLAASADLSAAARRNLFRFLSAALTSSPRYASVIKRPAAVADALVLFENSEYLTELLLRHPEEIAMLEEEKVRASTPAEALFESTIPAGFTWGGEHRSPRDSIFAYLASSSESMPERLAMLRRHYRHRSFAEGVRDLVRARGVYASLYHWTAVADDALAAAFAIAGAPGNDLAIIALGRLGTCEFDVLSDADVLFVCGDRCDRAATTRAAERIMHALGAYTRDGLVFPVDARLRPRGGGGELLITPAQLTSYFEREGQAWEALLYTKLRFVAGSRRLGDETSKSAERLFARFACDENFANSVREMRAKLEDFEQSFKTSPGGVYDIDFLTSYLLVRQGIPLKQGNLRDRIWRCVAAGVLDKPDAAVLDHSAELLRTIEHVTRLVVGRAHKWLPATDHGRKAAEALAARLLGRNFREGLEAELLRSGSEVRRIYEKIL